MIVEGGEGRMRHGDWCETFTGRQFWPLDPRAEEVDIQDIAHALSMLCRFNGHCLDFYSVAQHSVLVARAVTVALDPREWHPDIRRDVTLWGLLHDASEAYIGDVVRPIKRLPEFSSYRTAERVLQVVICDRFGLDPDEPPEVRAADNRMLFTERRDIMRSGGKEADDGTRHRWFGEVEPYAETIDPWPPGVAKARFLALFEELTKARP